MAPFTGFTKDDFDFFVGDDRKYAPMLKGRLRDFGEAVCAALPGHMRTSYNDVFVPNVKKGRGGAWVVLNKRRNPNHPLRFCNFDIGLQASALEALVFSAAIRGVNAIGVLDERISEQGEALTEYLQRLGPEFKLRISSIENKTGGRPLPGDDYWRPKHVQGLEYFIPENIPVVLGLLRSIPYPGIHLRGKDLSRNEVLEMSPRQLVDVAVSVFSSLYPFLRFVETGRFQD